MTNRIARIAGIAGLLAVAALLAAACGDDSGSGTTDDGATDGGQPAVEITAEGECTLSGDDVATGIIDFSITNGSDEPLVVVFLLIDDGQTLGDVQEAIDPPLDVDNPPDLTTYAARTTTGLPPGEEVIDAVALTEPGEYAAVCLTGSPPTFGVLASGSLTVSE
jgi:hypothetical protein